MRAHHAMLAVLVAILWGGNFIAAKFTMQSLPPFFLTAVRFTLVAALLVPFVKKPSREQMKYIALLSTTLGVGHFAPLIAGIWEGLNVSTAIICGQLGVPFSCIIGSFLMNDKLGKWRSLGLAVSFAGVVLVAGTPDVSGNAKGFALVLLAAMSWAVSNFVMKKTSESSILQVLGWMALFGAPQLYLVSWLFEEGQAEALRNITIPAATGLLYTILMSTIAAYGLWYHLMKIYPVSMVAPFSLLVPISGVSLSVLVFSEVLTTKMLVGGALTIIGVAIIVIRRPKLAVQGE